MKYIDSEKLKAEIERRKKIYEGLFERDSDIYYQVKAVAYGELLSFIDSLQQEQDCIVINKKDWEAQEQFKKNKDFGKPLKEEQPKKSKKDCNGCPHCVDRKDQYGWHFKGCFGGPYKGKFIAEIDECPLEQEHSEMDLEEEFIDFLEKENAYVDDNNKISYYNGSPFDHTCDIYPIARHFYNLGINAGKE